MRRMRFAILAPLLFLALAAGESLGQIQKYEVGGLAGVNLATTNEDISQWDGTHSSISTFHAGAFFRAWLQKQVALQASLLYNVKGGKQEYPDDGSGYSGTFQEELTYISLPITAMYVAPVAEKLGIGFFAGPEFGFMTGAKFTETVSYGGTTTTSDTSGTDEMSTFEMGLLFGAQVQYRVGSADIFLSYGYSLGLTKIHKDAQYDSKNRVQRISVGVSFPLK